MIWLLVLGYVALVALMLLAMVDSRWPLSLKLAGIVIGTVCYWFIYLGYRALEGWPAADELPESFRTQWIAIDEPDKSTGSPGAIYFWVRTLNDEGQPTGAPRAHALPFDQSVAEAAEAALGRLKNGETLNGYRTRQEMQPDATNELNESSLPEASGSFAGMGDDWIEFRDVPLPTLPAKPI